MNAPRVASGAILLLLGLGAVGCAPSLSSLVAGRHYREAICGAFDGDDADRALVGAALEKDTEAFVHVHAVTAAEMSPLLGDATRMTLERASFVRVRVRTNVMPVDRFSLRVSLLGDNGVVVAQPVGWQALAWATDEALPEKHRVQTYLHGGNVLRGLAAILSAGTYLFFDPFTQRTVEVDASSEEFERLAPHASALHGALRGEGCSASTLGETGQSCDGFFVVDRAAGADATLFVESRYEANRVKDPNAHGAEEPPCVVERTRKVRIGPARDLGASTERMFGDVARPLDDVATKKK